MYAWELDTPFKPACIEWGYFHHDVQSTGRYTRPSGECVVVREPEQEPEYESGKIGWGHSSFEHVCHQAVRANVKKMALFHHEPLRTDDQIDELGKIYCTPKKYGDVDIFFAEEGAEIEL